MNGKAKKQPSNILMQQPKLGALSVETQFHLAVSFHQQERFHDAAKLYESVVIANPRHADAWHMYGLMANQLSRHEQALEWITNAIKLQPRNPKFLANLGVIFIELKKYDMALEIYNKCLIIQPDNFVFHDNLGITLHYLNQFEDAIKSFSASIALKNDYIPAHLHMGLVFDHLNKNNEAIASFNKAIAIQPELMSAHLYKANTLCKLKQFDEAIFIYKHILLKDSENLGALINYSAALYLKGEFQDAVHYSSKALEINSANSDALSNRGIALLKLNDYINARKDLTAAKQLNPEDYEILNNLGACLTKLYLFDEAFENFEIALNININYADAYSNRGNTYKELKQYEAAVASYNKAISLNPQYAEAYANRGLVLQELKLLEEALTSYHQAIELMPDCEYLFGNLLHTRMLMCNWQDFETNLEDLLSKISNGKKSSPSFSVLGLIDSLSIQRKASEIWINDKNQFNASLGLIPKRQHKNKIRIGYYSADFREHPVSFLIAELFELHDLRNFELFAFYSGPVDSSNMHKRVASAVDRFIDIRLKSDAEVAQLSRDVGIDIAIDLTGLTQNDRVGIFSYRAAPVQLSYIGYLGTMGAEYFDYLIADKTIIPIESQQYYKEKIVYLPNYQVNDSKRDIADKIFTKVDLNLPEDGFVFCCFNNSYKITPPTFDGWMRILTAVPDSVLFLYAENKWAEDNLKLEAEKRGVSQTRLVFGARIGRSEYLARYRTADLFLDTLPYNAGTTASDALWAGLPVLTCMGESFASRVAASLLNAIELPELITTTQEQYEATAIELATNSGKLKVIKDKLERNRLTTALFDTPRFTNHIEAAYTKMYERYQSNMSPDNIYIEA